MKTLSYSEFINVVDQLNMFFRQEKWQIGNYGGLSLTGLVENASPDIMIPDCQMVLCVWYDDDTDFSAFPEPWYDSGHMRVYLL